jgi:DNA-binding NtrC family response regulator
MPNKKILLVDDEPVVLDSLGYHLEQHDFKVTTAQSGEEALAELRGSGYDLVITDLVMEGISGMEVLAQVKKSQSDVCVFILTGHGDTELAVEAFHSGVDDFILKPCESNDLIDKINRSLEKRAQNQNKRLLDKLLSVCIFCKNARNDTGIKGHKGIWLPLDQYLAEIMDMKISHGCCPDCSEIHKND